MTDIDDKLLEQQEQEQKEKDMGLRFEAGVNSRDKEEQEDFSETERTRDEILEREARQAQQLQDSNKKKEKKENGNGSGKVQSAADVLVQLGTKNAKLLFKDQYSIAHAQVHTADQEEIIRVESSKFKRYLARLFYDQNGNKVVNAESITNAIQVLQAVSITIDRDTKKNTSSIKMVKQPPEPPKPPEVENHAQNALEDFGGSTSSG